VGDWLALAVSMESPTGVGSYKQPLCHWFCLRRSPPRGRLACVGGVHAIAHRGGHLQTATHAIGFVFVGAHPVGDWLALAVSMESPTGVGSYKQPSCHWFCLRRSPPRGRLACVGGKHGIANRGELLQTATHAIGFVFVGALLLLSPQAALWGGTLAYERMHQIWIWLNL
jgi:hypothetical protein